MPQAQMQRSYIPVTISCHLCKQEQVVHIRARTGSWSMAHQSVRCVKCEQYFDVMIPDAIIGGPFAPQASAGLARNLGK
jgi:transcription elongation factor Elf1